MEQYLILQHVHKALVILFKENFNKSLWVDLNKGTSLGMVRCATYTLLDRFLSTLKGSLTMGVHWMLMMCS